MIDDVYERIVGLATEDINQGLAAFFEPSPGFRLAEFVPVQVADGGTWVAWTFEGEHNTKSFAGIEPTHLVITVHGVTFVDHTKDPCEFRRYIDWIDVCQQLGLSVTGRPAIDAEGR